eukprot:TRINITY_DN7157_c0_g2_i2.p1 TRINITY_DN7157_c0_g2~~TRINITY_DN7157_c0_g2_i2.p1  ORF type:complete len:100 (-),score=3.78 TRINITY_DN7157_c0_g2_i2:137-436(-)
MQNHTPDNARLPRIKFVTSTRSLFERILTFPAWTGWGSPLKYSKQMQANEELSNPQDNRDCVGHNVAPRFTFIQRHRIIPRILWCSTLHLWGMWLLNLD